MKKVLILSMSVLLLSSCEQEHSLSDVRQHPAVLRQEVARCKTIVAAREEKPYCTQVLAIADRFDEEFNRELQGTQAFGESVLQAQSACVAAKLALKQSEETLAALQAKHASPAEIKAAQEVLSAKKQAYEAQQEEMQILYGVLSQDSPG